MSGQEIKALILESGLRCWQVAYECGVNETTFSRWLRKPFDEKAVNKVKAAIAKLLKEKEQEESKCRPPVLEHWERQLKPTNQMLFKL